MLVIEKHKPGALVATCAFCGCYRVIARTIVVVIRNGGSGSGSLDQHVCARCTREFGKQLFVPKNAKGFQS